MVAQCAGIIVRLRLLTGILNSNPASLIFFDIFLGYIIILTPVFFIKSSVNNNPINSYPAPGSFGKASPPWRCGDPHDAIDLITGPITRKSDDGESKSLFLFRF